MFEYSYMPVWVIVLLGVLSIISIVSLAIANHEKYFPGEAVSGGVLGLFISAVIGLIAIIICVFASHTTTNNPIIVKKNPIVLSQKVETSKMNDFIKQSTGYDHVSVNTLSISVNTLSNEKYSRTIIQELAHGKIVEFTALDGDTKIDGSFYFDDDKMVIITSDEHEMNNKWTVGVN